MGMHRDLLKEWSDCGPQFSAVKIRLRTSCSAFIVALNTVRTSKHKDKQSRVHSFHLQTMGSKVKSIKLKHPDNQVEPSFSHVRECPCFRREIH